MPLPKGEVRITLSQAAQVVPNEPTATTLWNWQEYGLRGIRLEVERVGTRISTSEKAVKRFLKLVSDRVEADRKQVRARREKRSTSRVAS
ncbi:MAG TPA: DUF1580 domain-containing protein [Pirellulales bacterium]